VHSAEKTKPPPQNDEDNISVDSDGVPTVFMKEFCSRTIFYPELEEEDLDAPANPKHRKQMVMNNRKDSIVRQVGGGWRGGGHSVGGALKQY
jgi:hypothetical protein